MTLEQRVTDLDRRLRRIEDRPRWYELRLPTMGDLALILIAWSLEVATDVVKRVFK